MYPESAKATEKNFKISRNRLGLAFCCLFDFVYSSCLVLHQLYMPNVRMEIPEPWFAWPLDERAAKQAARVSLARQKTVKPYISIYSVETNAIHPVTGLMADMTTACSRLGSIGADSVSQLLLVPSSGRWVVQELSGKQSRQAGQGSRQGKAGRQVGRQAGKQAGRQASKQGKQSRQSSTANADP